MACPSCQKEWFFVDGAGTEHVEESHFKALQLRKKLQVPTAPIRSRKKPAAKK